MPLKNIGLGLLICIGGLIAVGLLLLFSPVIIVVALIKESTRVPFEKTHSAQLRQLEGSQFFCYNNRKDSQHYIETNILPVLSKSVHVIFLNGKMPESEFDATFISAALNSINQKSGFPYLLHISNGKLLSKSINNVFYSTMNQNKPLSNLLAEIEVFYKIESDYRLKT